MGHHGSRVNLTLYGGVRKIGGTKILLSGRRDKILFDFGKDISMWNDYYDWPFERPKTLEELIHIGLLPRPRGELKDLYTRYYDGIRDREPRVTACIISHHHADHIGYMTALNRRIKVYMEDTVRIIQQAYQDHKSGTTVEDDLRGFKEKENVISFRYPMRVKPVYLPAEPPPLPFDEFDIHPLAVDHSTPGSFGFLIRSRKKTLVYTGDFRWHGSAKELTDHFVKKAKEFAPIDFLLCDGTRVHDKEMKTEEDVEHEAKEALKGCEGFVVVNMSSMDVDRINTFYKVAKESGRNLVVIPKMASSLTRLKRMPIINYPDLGSIFVFDEKRGAAWRRWLLRGVCRKGPPDKTKYHTEYESGKLFRGAVTAKEIVDNPRDYIVLTAFYSLTELTGLYREWLRSKRRAIEPGLYIMSSAEPYEEEQEIDLERVKRWIKMLKLGYKPIHCSGHAYFQELRRFVSEIQPKTLIPIHTESPSTFKAFAKEGVKLKFPVYGTPIPVE